MRGTAARIASPARRPGEPRRRATIRDVALRAEVSLGTVSNVLNRPELVAPETRQRVLDAISDTGFVRSSAAHQLRAGKSRSIGVVILDVANPFFTELVRGIEHTMVEHGYALVLCSTDESASREQRYLRMLEEHRVEGVLATPAERDLTPFVALAERGVPTVLLDRPAPAGRLCAVTVDDARGGELAAAHLFGLGHRRIAFVNGPATIRQCADRRRGARRAARRAGLDAGDAIWEVLVPSLTAEQGEAASARVLEREPRPTAVMCANDLLALGVLKGVVARGLRVPEDLALIGYDDVAFSSMLSPALTSVRQPKFELGATAAGLLLEELSGSPHEHRQVVFAPELEVRASTTGAGRPVGQSAPPSAAAPSG